MATGTDFQCAIHPWGSLGALKYVVVCSFYEGRLLLSRHRRRSTWETQGGHIEPGETPLDAARRELFEESGVREARLYPVCDYHGWDAVSQADGAVFLAVVERLGTLPDSEMGETRLFDALPEELTYPSVTPALFRAAMEYAAAHAIRVQTPRREAPRPCGADGPTCE